MEPFVFSHGQAPWPDGLTLLHVYLLPDLARNPGLAALVAACRDAVPGEPLSHLADKWLHVTLCQIAVPAAEVTARQRAALAAGLGGQLAGTAPFTATVGHPFRVPTGVLLGVGDGEGKLDQVRARVVSAAGQACGPGTPLAGHRSSPHMTESYARGHADDDRIDRALGAVSPRRAPLAVQAVELVDVSVDQAAKSVTWRQVARIPLGG